MLYKVQTHYCSRSGRTKIDLMWKKKSGTLAWFSRQIFQGEFGKSHLSGIVSQANKILGFILLTNSILFALCRSWCCHDNWVTPTLLPPVVLPVLRVRSSPRWRTPRGRREGSSQPAALSQLLLQWRRSQVQLCLGH